MTPGCEPSKDWPRAPVHRLEGAGVFMITGATLHKNRLFNTSEKLSLLEQNLLSLARQFHWDLEAWAVYANHYHFIARSEAETEGGSLKKMIAQLHAGTARELNRIDQRAGRRVWYNFWDTRLTYQTSYLARLNYVHQNPVKHGLVAVASQYAWSSAAWFERTALPATVQTIYGFQTDQIKIYDEY